MHSKRVMGIHADRTFGYIYSISEDGRFCLTDMKTWKTVSDIQVTSTGLKYLLHNDTRGIFIMADGSGYVYIYN